MAIDVLTPKELTVYIAGAAIAPATAIWVLLYWLASAEDRLCGVLLGNSGRSLGMVLELISPVPLSPFVIVVTILPVLVVGIVINVQCWRRSFAAPVPNAEKAN